MADTAARLTDQVIPRVPVRHWTLSLPFPLRYIVAFDADLISAILGICVRQIYAWLRFVARREHGLDGNVPLHCGSVTAIHRADSAAKLNPHVHSAALDGVYTQAVPDGPLTFLPTPAPTRFEVADIAWLICKKTVNLLKRRGLALDATPEELDPHHGNEPLLGECATASLQGIVLIGPRAGRSILRLGTQQQQVEPEGGGPPQKPAHGFDLHTGRRVSADDRRGLERLLRYIMRPPLSHDRISLTQDGQVRLRLKRRWSDGTSHLILEPRDFIARLVPLVPPPRKHQLRYHGVLAPAAPLRAAVVPEPPARDDDAQLELPAAGTGNTPTSDRPLRPREQRIGWARLMRRVLGVDPLECPNCQRTMRLVRVVMEPAAIRAILAARGEESPFLADHSARGPPSSQMQLAFEPPEQVADAA